MTDKKSNIRIILKTLSEKLGLDYKDLVGYAKECPITIKKFKEQWIEGCLGYYDGLIIYVLVRVFKPENILEFGTFTGLGTKFMAQAVIRNGTGSIITVDEQPLGDKNIVMMSLHGRPIGNELTEEEKAVISFVTSDSLDYIKTLPDNLINFIFEDSDHGAASRGIVLEAKRVLAPLGSIVTHDYFMETVYRGYEEAGIIDESFYIEDISPGSLNFGMWRKETTDEKV